MSMSVTASANLYLASTFGKFHSPASMLKSLCALSVVFLWANFSFPAAPNAQESPQVESITLNAEEQFSFAERYFKTGAYFRAIGEYERFIFLFPNHFRVPEAAYRIAEAYLKNDQFREAVTAFTGFIAAYGALPLGINAHFSLSEALTQLKDYASAVTVLSHLISGTSDTAIADEAHYRIGWIYLEQNLPEKARESFDQISPRNRSRYRLELLSSELNRQPLFSVKNPKIAGWLSILPGTGFAYCGRYRDAAIALLLNAGFIWGGIEAFDDGNEPLGALILFIGSGFYAGNIYGAVSAAHKYNHDSHKRFLNDLRSKTGVSLTSDAQSPELRPALMVQWRF
jgi:TolA-binding protein